MRFNRKGGDRKPELNLASMIDATFLLLAFFIFTTGAGSNESKLSPNLRVQQGTDVADDLEPQVLEVLRVGEQVVFRLGSRDCPDRAELVASLTAGCAPIGLGPHVLRADTAVAAALALSRPAAGDDPGER